MVNKPVLKIVAHSATVLEIAIAHGWLPGARYTNLRDVRRFDRLGFLDIGWKNYSFDRHLRAAEETKPILTVARDIEDRRDLPRILDQAYRLAEHSERVIVVPKDEALTNDLEAQIPAEFALGYSVPTRYGGTRLPAASFKRATHLLGGPPRHSTAVGGLLAGFQY